MNGPAEARVVLRSTEEAVKIVGHLDENLRLLEQACGVDFILRGDELIIFGPEEGVQRAKAVVEQLQGLARAGMDVSSRDVLYALNLAEKGNGERLVDLTDEVLLTTYRGKVIKPRTHSQKAYIEAIKNNDIVFGIGPAGTGKTYLAVVMAAWFLRTRRVERIVLTRPAVEAGEKLGFLPGDLQEKVDPYLRPLYDGLYDIFGVEKTQKYMEKGIIEVAPLAYMRGRTLEEACIILDEAQNTTSEQMKMFLTRLGTGSKAIITGDVTQIDLPRERVSGLVEAREILQGIEGVAFCTFDAGDVQRHPLVQKIIRAYESRG